jgi:hypothetical protein
MINSIKSQDLWQEKQKNIPEVLSTSPAGVLWLPWNGQKTM